MGSVSVREEIKADGVTHSSVLFGTISECNVKVISRKLNTLEISQ